MEFQLVLTRYELKFPTLPVQIKLPEIIHTK